MIVGNVGTPGSGKSYDAIVTVVTNLKRGRTVCTNIDGLDKDQYRMAIAALAGLDPFTLNERLIFIKKDQVKRFWETETSYQDGVPVEQLICPLGSLIIIDEVHKHFNCRDWNSDANRGFVDWASTHRHDGYDVVLITQDIEKVDKQCRSLIEWCYYFRKVNFFGSLVNNSYLVFTYMGDDHSGKPLGKPSTKQYKKEYFKCYESYNSSQIKELSFMKQYNVLKHPLFLAFPVLIALFCWQFSKSSFAKGSLLPKYDNTKLSAAAKPLPGGSVATSTPISANAIQHAASSAQRTPFEPPKPLEYVRYRVDGWLQDGVNMIIQINGITVRLPNPDVLKFYRDTNTAVAKQEVFGPPRSVYPGNLQTPTVKDDDVKKSKDDKRERIDDIPEDVSAYKAIPSGIDIKKQYIVNGG